jgi:hypothetical protein
MATTTVTPRSSIPASAIKPCADAVNGCLSPCHAAGRGTFAIDIRGRGPAQLDRLVPRGVATTPPAVARQRPRAEGT